MRYLAILLLAPWLVILGWAYWAYPKGLPRTTARRAFDLLAVMGAAVAAVGSAVAGFEAAVVPSVGQFGPPSGAIWQQVLPALYGYGACVAVLVVALLLRALIWGRRRVD
ncbi:hypothetical protein KK141_02280 [Dyella sp. LX-66]|uniref:hypothetical protein n=1 Tax=unclassified Dyella TaxID=2634549 RepID=UPI001BE01650|nr:MULTISPECIES: hypothetical protein [unclassified Dyella]MBT2117296.1 hypothetical protein [Dyella sp. LX-1]MBT2138360.1 hypothetical protein [Dyella sp. LX-66]